MAVGTKNLVIQGCGAHHIAVQRPDWKASLNLYREVLGVQTVAEFGTPERKIVLLDRGDGSHMEPFQPPSVFPIIADEISTSRGGILRS